MSSRRLRDRNGRYLPAPTRQERVIDWSLAVIVFLALVVLIGWMVLGHPATAGGPA